MICLDIDGVICNPYDEINRHIAAAGVTPIPPENWTKFNTWELYPDLPKKMIQSWYRDPIVMRNAVPYADSWYWMQQVVSEGHKIILVTHRQKNLVARQTWRWIHDWEIPVEDVHFVSGDKTKVLKDLEVCSFFVEDKTQNAILAAQAGIETYLINRPYNKLDDAYPAHRIDSLWDINYGSKD